MSVPFKGLIAGAIGAVVLTALHELVRRRVADAPKLDTLGMRALGTDDRNAAMGADLASNTVYYSSVGTFGASVAPYTGVLLGLAAGMGSVALPAPLGLGNDTTADSSQKSMMSVGMYVAGGLAAGMAYQALSEK